MSAAPTEQMPAAGIARPSPEPGDRSPRRPPVAHARTPRAALWWPTLLVAGILCWITFYAKGGLNLESMTATEMALTLGSGVVAAGALALTPLGRRVHGLWPLGLLLAFTALSAVSIVWSVQPDESWQDAGRLLAYSGVFGAAVALVRLAPTRWPAILGGIALSCVIVCGYALLTKIFPGEVGPSDIYARLEAPFGYWNAVGLTAAMGAICCLWLGARRTGHALLRALAYPAMGLLLSTLALAYSRGALAALLVGLILWFMLVPLRLRGATVLILGALGAGALATWDFSNHALSTDNVPLAERAAAGHQLGALLVAMLLLLTLAGVAIGFKTARHAPPLAARRRAGAALVALILFVLIAFAGALAASERGLTGSISHTFDSLTNPNAKTPPNTPDRLTAVASVRARYWKEALQIFDAHPALGAGASGYRTARLRYRKETLEVRHAHGFVVQTLSDLGLLGLAVSLALLIAWAMSAWRAALPADGRERAQRRSLSSWRASLRPSGGEEAGWRRLDGRSPTGCTPERIGMLSMLCLVVVFGVHSLVDWTWYVPGNACVALLCAGWLAGRGPTAVAVEASRAQQSDPQRRERTSNEAATSPAAARRLRTAIAAGAIVAALLGAWSQWQPQRSEEARQEALSLLALHPSLASAQADSAVTRDPLSVEALFTLANVQNVTGQSALARTTLAKAVRLQPSNPQTWLALGRYDLTRDPRSALQELGAAIYLNPESIAPESIAQGRREAIEIHNDYIQALRASNQADTALKSARESRKRAAAGARRVAHPRSAPRSARSQNPRAAR